MLPEEEGQGPAKMRMMLKIIKLQNEGHSHCSGHLVCTFSSYSPQPLAVRLVALEMRITRRHCLCAGIRASGGFLPQSLGLFQTVFVVVQNFI